MNLADLFSLVMTARYITVEEDASFAAVGRGDTLYLLFQHSRSGTDWANNLDFPAVPYREMPHRWMCHRGFLKVWKAAEPYIEEILQTAGVRRITAAGYSHGGALAMLCHEYVWFRHPERRSGLTGTGFGAPRVLWRIPGTLWPKERWDTFTVIRYRGDPVTRLPPALFGYRHAGRLIPIGDPGRYSGADAHRPEAYRQALREMPAALFACQPARQ